jgi:CRP-like cAMP-binding protein
MSEPDAVRLEQTSLFKNVRQELIADTLARFTERTLAAGEEVFRQGEPGDALVVIISGQFEVLRHGATGEVHLAHLKPGAVLGHVSLVDGGNRSATLRANSEGRIAVLDSETFEQLWRDPSPAAVQLQMRIVQLVIEELRVANRRLAGLLDMPLSDTPEAIQRLMGVVDKVRSRSGIR